MPLSGQTNPEANGHYNPENAVHRSHPLPTTTREIIQSRVKEEGRMDLRAKQGKKMGHVTSLLGFPPYSILHTSYQQASTQYAASLLCRKLFSYFPQRKETQSSISIFVMIIRELQVICSHSHLFWMWFLIGPVTSAPNHKF